MLTTKRIIVHFLLSLFILFTPCELMASLLVNAQDLDTKDQLPLDILIESRTVNNNHAELFSKILIIDNEGRIKPYHTLAAEIIRKISRIKRTAWIPG